jgi:hypothetical protein
MAVTIITAPQDIEPAYNPQYWYINSADKTETGFRYIVDVVNNDTSEVLGTYKLRPIPTTLYGEVDVSKLLQTALTIDFQPTQIFYEANKHTLKYRIDIDEEYIVDESISGYGFAGSVNWTNHGDPAINPNGLARTRLIHATEPPFVAGDVINIIQVVGVNNRPELEGIQTVLDVQEISGAWATVLALPWIGGGSTSNAGSATYADGRKTIIDGISSDVKDVFRGAFSFMTYGEYNHETYELNANTKKLLTTLPSTFRISRNKPTWLAGWFTSLQNRVVFNIGGTLYRYNLGSTLGLINFDIVPSDDNISDVFSGGAWVAFGGGLDLSGVDSYTVQIQLSDDTPLSEVVTISLYDECDRFDTYDICFLDRLGSWVTVPFYKGSYINSNVDRKTIRRKYGERTDTGWEYNTYEAGEENYHVQENLTYTVNTGQLSEVESQYMKELLSTPKAFVSINGDDWQAINIQSSSLPLMKKRTTRERKVSLDFTMAVQDEING